MPHTAKPAPAPTPSAALLKQLDKAVRHHAEPLADIDHPAFCVLSIEAGSGNRVFDAMARLRRHFVDWNEMRHARFSDIARLLTGFPDAERRARNLRAIYNRLFEEKGRLDFAFLDGQKYTDGRRILLHIWPTFLSGAVALVLFEHTPGGQVPLTDGGVKAASELGLVDAPATRAQIQQKITQELPLHDAVRLIQHFELHAAGHPYGGDWNQPEPKLTRAGRAAVKAEAEARAASAPSMIPLPPSASGRPRTEDAAPPVSLPKIDEPPTPPVATPTAKKKKKKLPATP